MKKRIAKIERKTRETTIRGSLGLDGNREIRVATGIGFLDHLLSTLAFHASWDLELECSGDLEIDDHHTAEDCALALGEAIDHALGERTGIARFGWAYAPLDEALARAVIDLSGRPWPEIDLGLEREMIGGLAAENVTHVLQSLAMSSKAAVHVDVLRGANDHHRSEAAFKALALAIKAATAAGDRGDVPSTKGTLGGGGAS
jgi:imidazoleglycerol phosphate dehydratase HisB